VSWRFVQPLRLINDELIDLTLVCADALLLFSMLFMTSAASAVKQYEFDLLGSVLN